MICLFLFYEKKLFPKNPEKDNAFIAVFCHATHRLTAHNRKVVINGLLLQVVFYVVNVEKWSNTIMKFTSTVILNTTWDSELKLTAV